MNEQYVLNKMARSTSKLFSYISIIIRTMLVEIDTTPEVDPLSPDDNNSAAHYYQVYRCSCSALSNIMLHFQLLRLYKLISSLCVSCYLNKDSHYFQS